MTMNMNNNKFYMAALVLSAVSTSVLSEPVVTGATISWPADGWYQVQRADNYQNVCSGTDFCSLTTR